MARRYGTIATSVWDDDDFRALTSDAQRVYLMLVTQPEITSVGTVALTIRRWSNCASDTDTDSLSIALTELSDRLFIVVDWDREEVLVRTFVRWDGGYTNPKRLSAIRSAAEAVCSPLLSGVLAFELDKLGVAHKITECPIDSRSIAHPSSGDTPRVVVTEVVTTATHNPEPEPQPSSRPASQSEEDRTDVDEICSRLATWIEHNGVKRPAVTSAWKRDARLLIDKDGYGLPQVLDVIDWSQRDSFWQSNIQSVPKLREKFGQLMLKARTNGRAAHGNGTRIPTSDQRVMDGLAIAQRLAAEEQATENHALEIDA